MLCKDRDLVRRGVVLSRIVNNAYDRTQRTWKPVSSDSFGRNVDTPPWPVVSTVGFGVQVEQSCLFRAANNKS
jgi:hypothetical protein